MQKFLYHVLAEYITGALHATPLHFFNKFVKGNLINHLLKYKQ